jgi:hypothetical protein
MKFCSASSLDASELRPRWHRHTVRLWTGIILLWTLFVPPAFAQEPDSLPARPIALGDLHLVTPVVYELDGTNARELDRWIHEYKSWQEWAEKWLNRRQWVMHPFPYPFWKESPFLFTYVASPRVKPDPPRWLEAVCLQQESPSVESDPVVEACHLFESWKDDYVAGQIRLEIATARSREVPPPKSVLFEHIHFASLWTTVQAGSGPGAYGLAGVHATIDIHGRWQVYAFPGVMAVDLPNGRGERIVTIGYDWGFAIRLFDFRIPYLEVPAKAHLNVVKIWVPEIPQKIDMIGLSFTLKKK